MEERIALSGCVTLCVTLCAAFLCWKGRRNFLDFLFETNKTHICIKVPVTDCYNLLQYYGLCYACHPCHPALTARFASRDQILPYLKKRLLKCWALAFTSSLTSSTEPLPLGNRQKTPIAKWRKIY